MVFTSFHLGGRGGGRFGREEDQGPPEEVIGNISLMNKYGALK